MVTAVQVVAAVVMVTPRNVSRVLLVFVGGDWGCCVLSSGVFLVGSGRGDCVCGCGGVAVTSMTMGALVALVVLCLICFKKCFWKWWRM